ncbi:hypothetical protein FVER53590_09253 [Fusarium verticillioides]|nr:hypothetical protein FVER53590_09253 [Fusarium verticillioides]
MMLIKNGANLLYHGDERFTVLGLIATRGNWDLIWQIVDFAAEMDPDPIPELLRSLLSDLYTMDYETCYAAHNLGGPNGCINFWSRVISRLGSPNFSFQDGTTLMQMAWDSKSARALIDLGFDKFNQEEGDLLVHIVSLHDPSLFQYAVANGGDVHVRNDWGSVIVDMLLYDLLECNWKIFPTIWETLRFLVDRRAPILSLDKSMCKLLVDDSKQHRMWEIEQWNIGILAWLGMVENKRPVGEAKEVTLAALRQMSFDEADLHHACCTFCTDVDSNIDNDRFWDIQEQIKIDELNRAMEELAAKAYLELKIEVMVRLRRQWRRKYTKLWPGPKAGPVRQIFRSKRDEELNELLKAIRTSEHPRIPEPFLSSWNGIIQKNLDPDHYSYHYDIELGLAKFGIGLYQCGSDQFESWLPLLTQMTDVLLAEEDSGALES